MWKKLKTCIIKVLQGLEGVIKYPTCYYYFSPESVFINVWIISLAFGLFFV